MSIWTAPTELPDLRRVGIIAIDTETNDEGLHADRGSSWPWRDGYVCGISVAWREGGEIARDLFPDAPSRTATISIPPRSTAGSKTTSPPACASSP